MLKFEPFAVPAKFEFEDPDTGVRFHHKTKQGLINHIINYRAQNRLPAIAHLNLVLEDYWCRKPENTTKCVPLELKRGWIATARGAINVLENIFFGEENMVPQEVAEGRASICVQCPHNIFPDKGAFLEWSDKIAEASTGGRTTQEDARLGNCEVCSCPLRAKVHAKEVHPTEEELKVLPDFCWQKHG